MLAGCGGGGGGGAVSSAFVPSTGGGSRVPPLYALGVQIHPYAPDDPTTDLPLIIASGAKYVRCDLAWDMIENPAGTFDWDVFDQIYNNMVSNDITLIWLTGIGNPAAYGFGTGISAPITQEQIAEYVAFHQIAAQRYPNAWYEICNEPNEQYFWPPTPDASQYAALVNAVAPVIRSNIASTSKIISAGTSGIPIDFMTEYLQAGVSDLVDYVGFHPYGVNPNSLQSALKPLANVTNKPLFCTEYGTYEPATQSQDFTNMANACAALQIPFGWYELLDGEPNSLDPVNTYGLYTMQLTPKPVLTAAQEFVAGE